MNRTLYSVLLLSLPFVLHAQWTQVTSPTMANLWSVKFFDENVGYMNSNTNLLKTTDGGETWTMTSIQGNVNGDFSFPTSTIGYFAGFYDLVKKTTDQGATWTSIPLDNQALPIYSVSFVDVNTGYTVGANGIVRKTTNGGANWTGLALSGSPDLRHIHFVNADVGTAIGYNGAIRRTVNGGASWSAVSGAAGQHLNDIFFLDANIGFIAGSQGKLFKTIDGGVNWSPLNSGTTEHLTAVCFRNAQEGYVGGYSGFMMKTLDGGVSWTEEDNPFFFSTQSINDIIYKNGYWIAIGSAGKITRTSGANSIFLPEAQSSAVAISPNPASENFLIDGENDESGIRTVRILTAGGALVREISLSYGQRSVDVSDLLEGVYIVHVESGTARAYQKLIVQR